MFSIADMYFGGDDEAPRSPTKRIAASVNAAVVAAAATGAPLAASVMAGDFFPPVAVPAAPADVTVSPGSLVISETVAVPPAVRVVDATTRGIDDLDLPLWLAFTSAACFARLFAQYPFTLAMTRQQACPELQHMTARAMLRVLYHSNGRSFRPMYRGFGTMAAGAIVGEVGYLWFYEFMRNKNRSPLTAVGCGESQPALDAAAGFLSDAATTVCQVPFFIVANRQMCAGMGVAKNAAYKNAFRTFQDAMASTGPRGMMTGLSAALLLSTHSAYWWSAYGDMKARIYPALAPTLAAAEARYPWLPAPVVSRTDNILINTFASVVAGTVVAVVWNPAVVLQTRMQVADTTFGAPRLRDVARQIYRTDGLRGFAKGTRASIASTAIGCGAFSALYELGKQLAQHA